jgi:hypothetical protein
MVLEKNNFKEFYLEQYFTDRCMDEQEIDITVQKWIPPYVMVTQRMCLNLKPQQ